MTMVVVTPVTPFKTCEWCNTPFDPTHWNQIYCEDHREEAKKEKTRLRRRAYYQRNRKAQILSQVGTITMGPHPNPDPVRELEIVEKELKKISVTTVYKGKTSYNKGLTTFTTSNFYKEGVVLEYGDLPPLGIQLTHNYATFDDYVATSVSIWMTSQGPCPECESGRHLKDFSRCETACECGLLLYGAPHPKFKYPDDNDESIPLCPMSHEVKNQRLYREQQDDSRMRKLHRRV